MLPKVIIVEKLIIINYQFWECYWGADVDIGNAKVDDCFAIDGWEHPQRSSKIRCNYDEEEDVDVDDVDDVDVNDVIIFIININNKKNLKK